MRFVIYGAGAIGGVLGAGLTRAGLDTVLIARGPHFEAMRDRGLHLVTPDEDATIDVHVVDHPRDARIARGDVVVLTMKSQGTVAALEALARVAPEAAVVCAQNGVDNERSALRRFADVHGVCVVCPATHLSPGEVVCHSTPIRGTLDVGRYPHGSDETTEALADAFRRAGFGSTARADVMRWKYRKLLSNLLNAVDAVCGPGERNGELARRVTEEGDAVLAAAGVDVASPDEDAENRRGIQLRPAGGSRHRGSSSWQSLERGQGSIESDWLNGEIVLLGRLHGVPTPANALLQRLAGRLAGDKARPGSIPADEVLGLL